ncbi:MAG: hypothetical protein KF901_09310 [Myxococcales bacterium]|nr:hypothetical protein [Myxococcales bacterium]
MSWACRIWGLTLAFGVTVGAAAQRDGTPHLRPEGSAPPAGSELQAPTELAGFHFAWPVARARRACRTAGHRWEDVRGGEPLARCSGAARDPGFPAQVMLRFCEGRVCEVRAELAEDHGWGGAYVSALRGLRAAFGREHAGRFRGADAACVAALERAEDAPCFLRDGQARHYWSAGGGELELRLERAVGEARPRLFVVFRGAARVREIDLASN